MPRDPSSRPRSSRASAPRYSFSRTSFAGYPGFSSMTSASVPVNLSSFAASSSAPWSSDKATSVASNSSTRKAKRRPKLKEGHFHVGHILARSLRPASRLVEDGDRHGDPEHHYLVRWDGYGPEADTWEPRSGMMDGASDLVEAFDEQEHPFTILGARGMNPTNYKVRYAVESPLIAPSRLSEVEWHTPAEMRSKGRLSEHSVSLAVRTWEINSDDSLSPASKARAIERMREALEKSERRRRKEGQRHVEWLERAEREKERSREQQRLEREREREEERGTRRERTEILRSMIKRGAQKSGHMFKHSAETELDCTPQLQRDRIILAILERSRYKCKSDSKTWSWEFLIRYTQHPREAPYEKWFARTDVRRAFGERGETVVKDWLGELDKEDVGPPAPLSEYELDRQANMAANRDLMSDLGLNI